MFGGRKPAARKPVSSVPARPQSTTSTPAPAAPQGGGMMSGIGSTIAQGMAFGTGSAIAHRAVGAAAGMMGGSDEAPAVESAPLQAQEQQQQLQGACAQDKQMFFECLQINRGDQQSCSFLYDTLQSCQTNSNQNSNQMQFN